MLYVKRNPITHRITDTNPTWYEGYDLEPMEWEDIIAEQNAYPPLDSEVYDNITAYVETKRGSVVTFNGISATNNTESLNDINSIVQYLVAKDDPLLTIDWEGTPNVWYTATLADFQGLVIAGGDITEKAYTAKKATLAEQVTSPFATLAAAQAFFDGVFNS